MNPNWQSDLIADIRAAGNAAPPSAPATTQNQPPSQGRTYCVQPGDTLSKIAKHFYGDSGLHMKIFEANRNKLRDPNQIEPGQELTIPS